MLNPYDTETTLVNEDWSTDPDLSEEEDGYSSSEESDDDYDDQSNAEDDISGSEEDASYSEDEQSDLEGDRGYDVDSSGHYENERVIFPYTFPDSKSERSESGSNGRTGGGVRDGAVSVEDENMIG